MTEHRDLQHSNYILNFYKWKFNREKKLSLKILSCFCDRAMTKDLTASVANNAAASPRWAICQNRQYAARHIDHYLWSAVKLQRGFIAGTIEPRVLHDHTDNTLLLVDDRLSVRLSRNWSFVDNSLVITAL